MLDALTCDHCGEELELVDGSVCPCSLFDLMHTHYKAICLSCESSFQVIHDERTDVIMIHPFDIKKLRNR